MNVKCDPMNASKILFFTACDANFFALCMDLIASLARARENAPRMRVLDVGLTPEQSAALKEKVEAVIEPDWDMERRPEYPSWARAMLSRPFLPKYASDAEIIVWMDADTWVQTWGPLDDLICASFDGSLAIVEEQFGPGFTAYVETPDGLKPHQCDLSSVKANIRRCYEQCFDPEIVTAYGDLPQFNSGVFALRIDSPSWDVWRDTLGSALRRGSNKVVEQNALNVAIRQGRITVSRQPLHANFACNHDLPWFNSANKRFTLPGKIREPIGVMHLIDAKNYNFLPVPHFPGGVTIGKSLRFRDFF